jgi:hypothetical protein
MWTVKYFEASDGSRPARDFRNALALPLRAKLSRFAVAAAASGWRLGGGIFEKCHGYPDLFEIRAQHQSALARFFCTVDGTDLVLLDGVAKRKGEATSVADLERAAQRLAAYKVSRKAV